MGADSRVIFGTELDDSGVRTGLQKLGGVLGPIAKGAGLAIGAVSAGLGALAKQGLSYNSQMEQYTTSFTTMLGSAEAAEKKVAELKDFAAKTPFEMTDLANATKTILQFGVAEDRADKAMRQMGDISQGNAEKFSALSLVYGQVASTGKLMGQDLLQMINAGFNPLQQIAEQTGASMGDLKAVMSGDKTSKDFTKRIKEAQSEVKKLGDSASPAAKMLAQIGEEGMISADMVDQAMTLATSKGGLFYQAMEKQSETFAGKLSTLKDNFNSLVGEVFGGLSATMAGTILPMASGYVDQLSHAFSTGGTSGLVSAIGNVLGSAISKAAAFTPKIVETSVSIIKSFVAGIKSNSKMISKGLGEAIKSALSGIVSILPSLVSIFFDLLMQLAVQLAEMAPDLIPQIVDAMLGMLEELISDADQLTDTAVALIDGLSAGITKAIPKIIAKAPEILNGLAEGFTKFGSAIMLSAGNGIIDILNAVFGSNIPHLENIKFPSWDEIKESVSLWWEDFKVKLVAALDWVLGAMGLPSWETLSTQISTWWAGISEQITAALDWALGKLGLPSVETMVAELKTWWDGIWTNVSDYFTITLKVKLPSVEDVVNELNTPQSGNDSGWVGIQQAIANALFGPEDSGDSDTKSLNKSVKKDITDTGKALDTGKTTLKEKSIAVRDATMEGLKPDDTGTVTAVGTGISDSVATGITDSTSIKDELSTSVEDAIETSQTDNQDDAKLLGGAIVTKTAAGVTANTQIRAALSSRVLIAINGSYLDNAASAKYIGSALVNAISSGVVAQGWALNATIKQIVMDALNAAKLAAGLPVDSDKSSGVTSAINAGKSALDNTLLGRVQSAMLSGGYYPSASQLSASALRNSAAGIYNAQYASSAQAKNINIEQKMYFGDNIQTPDEIARAVKRQTLVGLAGGKA